MTLPASKTFSNCSDEELGTIAMNQNRSSNSSDEANNAMPLFVPRSLINVSQTEIEQAAINYTKARFTDRSESVEVAHIRSVTIPDLVEMGLGEINFLGEEPPLMLVVVKGDLDVSSLVTDRFRGLAVPQQTKYIAYVFDLRAGLPCFVATKLTGPYFRHVMNDQSIPDPPKEIIGPEAGKPDSIPGD